MRLHILLMQIFYNLKQMQFQKNKRIRIETSCYITKSLSEYCHSELPDESGQVQYDEIGVLG